LLQNVHRARHCRLFPADENAIPVETHDDRNERFKRCQVLIVLTENAQRIDGSAELEYFFAADLLDGYASSPQTVTTS